MKQFGWVTAVAAVTVLAAASAPVSAQGGQFFVDGSIGRSSYSLSGSPYYNDKTDWSTSIRAGFMWHGFVDYGLELGYVDLGQAVERDRLTMVLPTGTWSYYSRYSTAANGWLAGGRLEYVIGRSWYVMARGGWFRPRITEENSEWEDRPWAGPWEPLLGGRYGHVQASSGTGTQSYFGLGIGYCFSTHWRVGLNYEYYGLGSLAQEGLFDHPQAASHVKTYSSSIQYRF